MASFETHKMDELESDVAPEIGEEMPKRRWAVTIETNLQNPIIRINGMRVTQPASVQLLQ